MQISTKFTSAIHILVMVAVFGEEKKITSNYLAGSIGVNPVIVRGLMSDFQKAGLIKTKRGPGGITITKPLSEITFYDVYEAVEKSKDSLFHFHDHPNPQCPVGRNIHSALDEKLREVQHDFEEDLKRFKVADVTQDMTRLLEEEKAG